MKKVIIVLFLISSFHCSFGQNQLFYACTATGELLKLNISTCDTTYIGNTTAHLFDIALTPDGKLYGVTNSREIVEIDTSNAITNTITTSNLTFNSLVSDSLGNLLSVFQDSVYQINRFTGQIITLGYYGPYVSSGDLTFYKDTLYLSAHGNKLVKIILSPVISSQVVGTMSAADIFGINTVCLNGREAMIASANNFYGGSLYIVDPTNAQLTLLCDTIVHNGQINGATSRQDFSTELNCFLISDINIPASVDDLNIFPNPVTDILNVSYKHSEPVVISIFDVASKQLIREKFTNSVSLNIENLSAGVYIFRIETAKGIIKQGKLLKNNN